MQPLFTAADVWLGGFYELDLYLEGHDDSQVALASRTLWSHPDLDGPYGQDDVEPEAQDQVSSDLVLDRECAIHLFGMGTPPDGKRIPCGSLVCWEDDADILVLYFPAGALDLVYGIDWDRHPEWGPWMGPFDEWLEGIARFVNEDVTLAFASISEEGYRPGVNRLLPDGHGDLVWEHPRS